ncbi:MAG: DUF3108 domain-containing protein [Gammaproteobacteria bacterium]|nr:DUF3108 domain-containing protein [Gammaproteobacteria bacterium]
MRTSIGLLISICAGLAWSLPSAADGLPEELTLRYSVRLGSAELGSLLTRLKKQENSFRVESETRAEGVASILLGGEVRETCEFEVEANQIRPLRYEVAHEGRKGYRRRAEFRWQSNQVAFSSGEIAAIPNGYILDNCSVPFAFMLGGSEVFSQTALHVVGGRRIRNFEHMGVTHEELKTPFGKLPSIRIEQRRTDNPTRKLIVWLAPSRHNLPVKMVEKRKSRVVTMVLKSVEGL